MTVQTVKFHAPPVPRRPTARQQLVQLTAGGVGLCVLWQTQVLSGRTTAALWGLFLIIRCLLYLSPATTMWSERFLFRPARRTAETALIGILWWFVMVPTGLFRQLLQRCVARRVPEAENADSFFQAPDPPMTSESWFRSF